MIYINDFSRKFEIDLYSVCENSPYGARIISYHTAYHGRKYDFLDFWLQRNENNVTVCAFCKYYSTLIICGVSSDINETEDFIRMISPFNILCDESLGLNLDMNLSNGETMACSQISTRKREELIGISRLKSDMIYLKEVYSLLVSEGEAEGAMPDFESYFLDMSHRIRHATAEVYAVYNSEGSVISTASVLAVSKMSAVIGCVATHKNERSKGYATAVVSYITEKELKKGRTVYLHREKKISIYEKIGFRTIGYWNEFTL